MRNANKPLISAGMVLSRIRFKKFSSSWKNAKKVKLTVYSSNPAKKTMNIEGL